MPTNQALSVWTVQQHIQQFIRTARACGLPYYWAAFQVRFLCAHFRWCDNAEQSCSHSHGRETFWLWEVWQDVFTGHTTRETRARIVRLRGRFKWIRFGKATSVNIIRRKCCSRKAIGSLFVTPSPVWNKRVPVCTKLLCCVAFFPHPSLSQLRLRLLLLNVRVTDSTYVKKDENRIPD